MWRKEKNRSCTSRRIRDQGRRSPEVVPGRPRRVDAGSGVGFRLGRRLPADRLAGNPRYRRRRSSAMYRYARGAPGLREVPFCWSLAPFSSLAGCMAPSPSRVALPCCLAAEHGNGLRRPRLSSGRTLVLGRVRRESRLSASLASLPLAPPRLAESRVLATSARERLVYRFGFRSNYLQRCSRAGEKHVDRRTLGITHGEIAACRMYTH